MVASWSALALGRSESLSPATESRNRKGGVTKNRILGEGAWAARLGAIIGAGQAAAAMSLSSSLQQILLAQHWLPIQAQHPLIWLCVVSRTLLDLFRVLRFCAKGIGRMSAPRTRYVQRASFNGPRAGMIALLLPLLAVIQHPAAARLYPYYILVYDT